MNISQKLDQATNSLDQINWKKVFSELSELWILLWKIVITLVVITKVAGETLGNWMHRTNDQLAANWVRMLALNPVMEEEENEEEKVLPPTVPSTPTEVEQTPLPGITEEVSVPTPPTVVEVEPLLPPVAEVVEISTLQEQPPPVRRRRRSSAQRSLEETVNEEIEPTTNRRPRGRRAHAKRNRAAA